MRHLLEIDDLSSAEVNQILDLANECCVLMTAKRRKQRNLIIVQELGGH